MGKVVAIIPARGGSKGIPRKNLKDFNGIPLVAHTIKQAKSSKHIDLVVVNSEDDEIRRVAKQFGAEVMDRPEEFHHDNTIQEVDRLLIWTVNELTKRGEDISVIVLLYSTAPLREIGHIDDAVEKVQKKGFDSVLSIYEDSTYLWKVNGLTASPTNYDPKTRGPRQKESWNQWAENKAVYVMTKDLLLKTGCRLGGKIGYVEMSKLQSIDIDKPEDLELARLLDKLRND
jgi:CMP-N,N'-diacetyllegionaminic acid synthase